MRDKDALLRTRHRGLYEPKDARVDRRYEDDDHQGSILHEAKTSPRTSEDLQDTSGRMGVSVDLAWQNGASGKSLLTSVPLRSQCAVR